MKEFICLECIGLDKTLAHLDRNPLESIVSYDNDLQKYTDAYGDEYFNLVEQTEKFHQLMGVKDVDDSEIEEIFKLKCSECKEEFAYEDFMIEKGRVKDFLIELCELLAKEISDDIELCSNCDIMREYFEYNKTLNIETGVNKEVKGKSLEGFLADFGFPEKYAEIILPFLKCSHCETNLIELNKNNVRIYSYDDISDYLSTDFEEISLYADAFGINLKKDEISGFSIFLRMNTMLGLKHITGIKLYELFEKIFKHGEHQGFKEYMILENKKLYRGRVRDIESEKFTDLEMWNPPVGVSTHGRYNLVGSSVLYLANDKDMIPYEVDYKGYQLLDIATVSINRPLKILDLSSMYGEFGRILSTNPSSTNILKLEYLLTNYIADCCRVIGFNGIKYRGVKEGEYENYVLLNFRKEIDISIDNVETYKPNIRYSLNQYVQ